VPKDLHDPSDFSLSLDDALLQAAVASVEKHMGATKAAGKPGEPPVDTSPDLDVEIDLDDELDGSPDGVELTMDLGDDDDPAEVIAPVEPTAAHAADPAELSALRTQLEQLEQELKRQTARSEQLTDQRDEARQEAVRNKQRGIKFSVARKRLAEAHDVLKRRHAALRARIEELEPRFEELQADHERAEGEHNRARVRHQRELEEVRSFANARMAKALMPSLDNLDLAMQHAESTPPEQMVDGVRMIYSQLAVGLAQVGLVRIEQTGVDFDPERHEAIAYEPDASNAGTVIVVHQVGYQLNDRLLRAARVTVSSGPPEPAVPEDLEVQPSPAPAVGEE
jgi:molecular chaperone GrpE